MIGSFVDCWLLDATDLARPKSASLARQSESNRILLGLRSLWINYPECIYFMPLRILNLDMIITDIGCISYERFLRFLLLLQHVSQST